MNYTDVKKLDTVLTENEYVENRVDRSAAARSEETVEEVKARIQKRRLPQRRLPLKKTGEKKPGLLKSIKNKIDIYDALMIPVGAGIIVAFIMLALKLI